MKKIFITYMAIIAVFMLTSCQTTSPTKKAYGSVDKMDTAAIVNRIIGVKMSSASVTATIQADYKITGYINKTKQPIAGRWQIRNGDFCPSFYEGLHIKQSCSPVKANLNAAGKITSITLIQGGKGRAYQLETPA